MSMLEKLTADRRNAATKRKAKVTEKASFKARPCGDIDYKALAADVRKRYPKILARLAE